jgi:hypothetical protein
MLPLHVLSFAITVTVVGEVAGTDVTSTIPGFDERSTAPGAFAGMGGYVLRKRVRSTAHVRLRVVRNDGVIRRLPGRRPPDLR